MFLRHTKRRKDGKEHFYWSVVENRRCKGGRILQKTVLYLGEINDSQKEQWIRAIEVFDENLSQSRQLKLFSHQHLLRERPAVPGKRQAKEQSPSAWRLVDIHVEADGTLRYQLNRNKLKEVTLREGRYLLRSNLTDEDPARIWNLYMRLMEIEECFRNLKVATSPSARSIIRTRSASRPTS